MAVGWSIVERLSGLRIGVIGVESAETFVPIPKDHKEGVFTTSGAAEPSWHVHVGGAIGG